MKPRVSLNLMISALLLVFAVAVGCTKAPNDAQITSDIQNRLSSDSGLKDKQLAVQVADGTVTLAGSVENEGQRDAAAKYAASAAGVKQVVNNLTVAAAEETMMPPMEESKPATKPRASTSRPRVLPSSSHSTPTPEAVASPATSMTAANDAPMAPPPPQKVTVPAGTTLAVRLVDTIDSETAQPGQSFSATLESPLSVDGDIVIPTGYDVQGHVVDVKSAGKFAGRSELTLQLDRISVGGKSYSIQTDQFHREGSSRGKNTAAKVGGGAAIGAIIGGIAGGGKGAAIGAAAGGGLGGGVQAATKGQQIKLASETVLNFTLQSPVTVTPAKGAHEGRSKIE